MSCEQYCFWHLQSSWGWHPRLRSLRRASLVQIAVSASKDAGQYTRLVSRAETPADSFVRCLRMNAGYRVDRGSGDSRERLRSVEQHKRCPWRIRKSSHKRIGPGSLVRYRHRAIARIHDAPAHTRRPKRTCAVSLVHMPPTIMNRGLIAL